MDAWTTTSARSVVRAGAEHAAMCQGSIRVVQGVLVCVFRVFGVFEGV